MGVAGLLAGCVHYEQDVILRADGSGEVIVGYFLPDSTRRIMGGYLEPKDPNASLDRIFDADAVRREFESYESLGVRLKDIQIADEETGRHVRMELAFDSLDGLTKTPLFSESRVSLRRRDGGPYVFLQTGSIPTRRPAHAVDPFEFMGLRVELQYTVPGRIHRTNADRHDENTAAWIFDLDRDPNALRRLERPHLRIEFEAPETLPEIGQQHVRIRVPGP